MKFILTTNSKGVLTKVLSQLTERGSDRISSDNIEIQKQEQRVIVTGGQDEIRKLTQMQHVERVLLEVGGFEAITLDEVKIKIAEIDWISKLEFIQEHVLKTNKPLHWTLDSRRTIKSDADLRKIEIQNSAREGIVKSNIPLLSSTQGVPDVMIYILIKRNTFHVSIPILSKCPPPINLPTKGLHHAISWGLALTANITEGEFVLDPCVGKAGLLLETEVWSQPANFIGCELNSDELSDAVRNISAVKSNISLMQTNFIYAPFRDNIVDVILSDLPFGRKHGDYEGNKTLYPAIASQVSRLLSPTGRAVLLTSEECHELLITSLTGNGFTEIRSFKFNFGGNRNTQLCYLVCAAKSKDAVAAFDCSLAEKISSSQETSWMSEKPKMQRYRPKQSRIPLNERKKQSRQENESENSIKRVKESD